VCKLDSCRTPARRLQQAPAIAVGAWGRLPRAGPGPGPAVQARARPCTTRLEPRGAAAASLTLTLQALWAGAGAAAAWGRLDKAALEACLCTTALALATVMAGSGHLPTLRLLRGAPALGHLSLGAPAPPIGSLHSRPQPTPSHQVAALLASTLAPVGSPRRAAAAGSSMTHAPTRCKCVVSQTGEAPCLCERDGLLPRVGSCGRCCLALWLSGSAPAVGAGHRRLKRLNRAGLRKRLCPVAPAGAAAGGAAANYASHAAVSMALGFLFLGGGARTFGTDDASVAALVVALFPRFPMSPTDQRCHLQARPGIPYP
jgi:hypothetical protein